MFAGFIGFMLVIVAAIIFVPRRYFGNLLGWLAIPGILIAIDLHEPYPWRDPGLGHTFAVVFSLFAAWIIGAAIVIRLAIIGFLEFRKSRQSASAEQAVQQEAVQGLSMQTRVQLVIAGVTVGFGTILLLSSALQQVASVWFAHLIAMAVILVIWLLPGVLSRMPPADFAKVLFRSFRWTLTGLVAAAFVMPVLVVRNAEDIAGDEPYCIQVTDVHEPYRAAGTWLDLSGLRIEASNYSDPTGIFKDYIAPGAYLIVGKGQQRRWYIWSYRNAAFIPTEPGLDLQLCAPERGFARQMLFPSTYGADRVYVRVGGHTYKIPVNYRPGFTFFGKPNRGRLEIIIAMIAPNFTLHDWAKPGGRIYGSKYLYYSTHILFDAGRAVRRLRKFKFGVVDETEFQRIEALGLSKRVELQRSSSHTVFSEGGQFKGHMDLYQGFQNGRQNADGEPTTVIRCASPTQDNPLSCVHRFRHGDMSLGFRHRREDVANWRAMQEKLIDRLNGFAVHEDEDRGK